MRKKADIKPNTLGFRLEEIRTKNRLPKTTMADMCGLQESRLRSIITGVTENPGYMIIVDILKAFPTISIKWLLFGEGEMHVSDENIDESQKKANGRDNGGMSCMECMSREGQISQLKAINESLVIRNEGMSEEIGRLKEKLRAYEEGKDNMQQAKTG